MRARGLSLVEVLVVLAILAAMAGALVLAFPDLGGRRADNEAQRLLGLFDLACDRAAFTGRDVGIALGASAYAFGQFRDEGFEPFPGRGGEALRPRRLAPPLSLRLRVDGRPVALAAEPPELPQLACLASGERVAFELELLEAGRPGWRLSAASIGPATLEAVDGR
ncbi:MAG: prepilin-type N-terminal cleavage/methylation domain-containing protein [Lysobacteraceae bacterium]